MVEKASKDGTSANKSMYSLTWTYEFEYDHDVVFFSHSFPYSATQWYEFIETVDKKWESKNFYRKDVLCSTLGNRPCYMLTITDNIDSYLTASEERKYFSYFSKEFNTIKDEEQSISELAKSGYKAVSDKIPDIKHDVTPPAFKKSTKQLEKAMSTK